MTVVPRRWFSTRALAGALALALLSACCGAAHAKLAIRPAPPAAGTPWQRLPRADRVLLDSLEARTFDYFWDLSDARNGLTPDRWPTHSFASVGAMGFALTAYPIGAERGWVTREQAAKRTLATLRFLWSARQDTARAGATGYRGFFYHFLRPEDGARFEHVELSSIDTALLMGGVLFTGEYFNRPVAREREVRALAESLYRRVDWAWMQPRPALLCLGWSPEEGHLPYDTGGYNETVLMLVLAMGSPSHPAAPGTWERYTKGFRWGTFHGQDHLGFAPLFGHQYSHAWIDFRGVADPWLRARGIDYFENSRRATLAQRRYAIDNPGGFTGYGPNDWGLTACDGPIDGKFTIDGRLREFHTYEARGASHTEVIDDGTLSPSAVAGSLPFAPEVVVPALRHMRATYGPELYSRFGFVDAYNPTFKLDQKTPQGRVNPALGWFDTDYLGIDEGPILLMIENFRSGLVWRSMRHNPHLRRGLRAAGFRGGWLGGAAVR